MRVVSDLEGLLRPAGGGIHTITTGKLEQEGLQCAIYGVSKASEIVAAWRRALSRIESAAVVVLGVPSDVGAGFRRGASFGPQRMRSALLAADGPYRDPRVVDAGDVFVVPQLLDDAMLSAGQLRATRLAIYGDAEDPRPVSPLTATAAAVSRIRQLAPHASVVVLGGDHSVAWPAVSSLCAGREQQLGILHFDAHTDLLENRLGVRYCFATWAYHANELVSRSGRLVQVGVRISGRDRAHWESTLGVRQHWAKDANARDPEALAAEIVAHFKARSVRGLYISNDIDGTDPAFAAATGTPEPGGLHPDLVCTLIREVGREFEPWGSDLVEVAPPLSSGIPEEPGRTLDTAVRYLHEQIALGLNRR